MKVLGFAVAFALAVGVAHAQEAPVAGPELQVATIDPNAPLPPLASVQGPCEAMAEDPSIADAQAGPCVSATQQFVAQLAPTQRLPASEGALSPADQALSDLVVAIATITQDEICDVRDEELAAAVSVAGEAASDAELRASLLSIAATIRENCEDGTTAAITPASAA